VAAEIARLVGVYDAKGSLVGELSYFLRARIGRAHCALCEITHGRLRERKDWQACRSRLPAPFETFHRDDQPARIRDAAGAEAPAVVAETIDGKVVTLAGATELEQCAGSPERLVALIDSEVRRHGLQWPEPSVER